MLKISQLYRQQETWEDPKQNSGQRLQVVLNWKRLQRNLSKEATKSSKITELQRNQIGFLHMQKQHVSIICLIDDVCWCCILHFRESYDIMIIVANQSIPRAFRHYSAIRSRIQRRLCTRARFQSCVLSMSSLHSSNQRLWGLGGYLPRSTFALGPCQQHDANFWQL